MSNVTSDKMFVELFDSGELDISEYYIKYNITVEYNSGDKHAGPREEVKCEFSMHHYDNLSEQIEKLYNDVNTLLRVYNGESKKIAEARRDRDRINKYIEEIK